MRLPGAVDHKQALQIILVACTGLNSKIKKLD